jgi:hypothetical protein
LTRGGISWIDGLLLLLPFPVEVSFPPVREADHPLGIYLDNLTVTVTVALMLPAIHDLVLAVFAYHYCSAILTIILLILFSFSSSVATIAETGIVSAWTVSLSNKEVALEESLDTKIRATITPCHSSRLFLGGTHNLVSNVLWYESAFEALTIRPEARWLVRIVVGSIVCLDVRGQNPTQDPLRILDCPGLRFKIVYGIEAGGDDS